MEPSPPEHDEWALRMWKRMDRDHSESITRLELDCEEFRTILRAIIAPHKPGMGGTVYERAEMNMDQAINFCLRKADLNTDSTLSFKEFKSFTWCLRQDFAKHSAHLIYSLFDLDANGRIDEAEFREIYRFFLGHNPTEVQFQKEWTKLDIDGRQHVTRDEFFRWLQLSRNPIFKQHAPPLERQLSAPSLSEEGSKPSWGRTRFADRPMWNERFNTQKNINESAPPSRRNYFLRPQSETELERHYARHKGFTSQLSRLMQEVPPKPLKVLSTDTTRCFAFNPQLDVPGGTMSSKAGMQQPWEDHWQTPKCVKKKLRPGSLDIRCPGQPPKWMFGRDSEDI